MSQPAAQPTTLDVRWPLGSLFSLIGVLLVAYGLVYDNPPVPGRAAGLHIYVWWGGLLFIFGLTVLALATWARRPQLDRPR